MLSKNMSAMVGMKFGVNMLRADPKLWVPVGANYNGFAFKPKQGWLSNANTKASAEHSRHTNKRQSAIHSMPPTTVNVR